ncbi:hypothetical protein SAMN05421542_3507 [Chryseobacterium jejuense]|uniref:Uncharacterized protein n=1 Tax=Chryseobacterium jejuense TaxID=445960 RepID=A0A2X2X267_CHRJE|nr:hypothetical protein SAMN05421542_3507 [Chryseobacterium jejuense]SQB46007.1 Uncharacterised protein [Chryseobacterium jejuense]
MLIIISVKYKNNNLFTTKRNNYIFLRNLTNIQLVFAFASLLITLKKAL